KRYLEKEIPVVLGTDGYGIYQSTAELEARAALLAGLLEQDLHKIRETEYQYLKMRDHSDGMPNISFDFDVPDDPSHKYFTPEVMERNVKAKRLRDTKLTERLASLKIPLLDSSGLNRLLLGKKCISFAGAWYKSWNLISPEQQENVRTQIRRLFEALNPNEVVVITGGTRYGVENVVQKYALPRGFPILGVLVKETPPQSIEPASINYACLVGVRLYDKAAGLYRLMKDYNGLCVFIGGGNVVSDEIMTAGNLRLRYLLMDGPEGAGSTHAKEQPERAFTVAEDILKALCESKPWTSKDEPYWH